MFVWVIITWIDSQKVVHYEDTKTIIVQLHHPSKRVKNEVLCFTSTFYMQKKHKSELFQQVASMKT